MINKCIARLLPLMPKKLIWIFSKKYIAGITIEEALAESKVLNQQGCMVTVDILGEYIKHISEATKYKTQYLEVINKFTASGVNGNFSVKPSMFGLLLDKEVCYENIREIVKLAAEKKSFIRIDMEDATCTDIEIDIYRRLKEEFPTSVGLVLQAYLHRTYSDIEKMLDIHTDASPLSFRLCKGIYVEDKSIAFKGYQEIRDNYLRDLELMFQKKIYVGIATHDQYLVEESMKLIKKYGVSKDWYEFQMLYGVTPQLRQSIIDKGHRMRIYVPFGKDWFGYSTRRLKENPNMVSHIVKALFIKG